MSRIGKMPISIPAEVTVTKTGNEIVMKSNKGSLSLNHRPEIKVEYNNNEISVQRSDDTRQSMELHGLTRTLINNMVIGLTDGYKKNLEIVGIGYKVEVKGIKVIFNLGYSHPIYFYPPEGVKITAQAPTKFSVEGIDKELIGEVAAKIRNFRPPEPYKGKGIRYQNEQILRKAGKTGKK